MRDIAESEWIPSNANAWRIEQARRGIAVLNAAQTTGSSI